MDFIDIIWFCFDYDKFIFYNNWVFNCSYEYNGIICCVVYFVVLEMCLLLFCIWIDNSGYVWSFWFYFIRSLFFVCGIVYLDIIMYNNSSFIVGWCFYVI